MHLQLWLNKQTKTNLISDTNGRKSSAPVGNFSLKKGKKEKAALTNIKTGELVTASGSVLTGMS